MAGSMRIAEGFQIEQPNVFVPWGIPEAEIEALFDGYPLRRVTQGYYTIPCVSLGGLAHDLGFHFDPRGDGVLVEFEFFRSSHRDLKDSYAEFQSHLEKAFGPPTRAGASYEGLPSCRWALDGAELIHLVQERFGPEEHVRLRGGRPKTG